MISKIFAALAADADSFLPTAMPSRRLFAIVGVIAMLVFASSESTSGQAADAETADLSRVVNLVAQMNALPVHFWENTVNGVTKMDVSPDYAANVRRIAELMRELPAGTVVEVGAHVFPLEDTIFSEGGREAEMKLTSSRAEILRRELLRLGVGGVTLTAKGYGSTKPVASNATTEGQLKNVRVEFLIAKLPTRAVPAQTAAVKPKVITAGRGWGDILAGASRSSIESALGKPDDGGDDYAAYYAKGIAVTYDPAGNATAIRFIGDAPRYSGGTTNYRSFSGAPDKGLRWGASQEQVIAAYGAPVKRAAYMEVAEIIYPDIEFNFRDDKLTVIAVKGGKPPATMAAKPVAPPTTPTISEEERKSLGKELFGAVEKGETERAVELIKRGALLTYESGGDSTLDTAIRYRRTELAKILLEAGADPNYRDSVYGGTALHMAAQMSNFELVKLLVEKYKVDVNVATRKGGRTPLIQAADFNQNDEIVRYLVEHGADPNAMDQQGQAPLYFAKRGGKADIAEFLSSVADAKTRTATAGTLSVFDEERSTSSSSEPVDKRSRAVSEYEKVHESVEADIANYNDAIQKYNNAGQAQYLYKGTLGRAYRALDSAARKIEQFLDAYGKYLPKEMYDHMVSDYRKAGGVRSF